MDGMHHANSSDLSFRDWLVFLSSVRVCSQEVPGTNESGLGVRHEQRGKVWYHCEPWIRRALRG